MSRVREYRLKVETAGREEEEQEGKSGAFLKPGGKRKESHSSREQKILAEEESEVKTSRKRKLNPRRRAWLRAKVRGVSTSTSLTSRQIHNWAEREQRRNSFQLRLDWEIREENEQSGGSSLSEVIHPISQHLKPLLCFKTAHELFGVSKPTFFHHHPSQFTIMVLPMTILAEMNEMVLQRRKIPIG